MTNFISKMKEQKENEYREYIKEHVNNVITVFNKLKELNLIPNEIIDQLEINVHKHDESKYSPEEFDAYRRRFFPVNEAEKKASFYDFNLAWEHHKKCNPHHSESPMWYDERTKTAKPMDPLYAFELICDWQAMSIKFNNRCIDFYHKYPKYKLHQDTRNLIEPIIMKLDSVF
ncbi:hypothetical protein TVAG_498640 [Trichomonas vaginalis G3]|uniref:Uncharacterized protein n=1 Tax=Trichomonas vaginalis (strain ATCC PRA-98 / G3) TaxID=412133 RepID=A2E852_TRIV3|nr:Family of unknown function (DUF5662) family [Trichomonas vaginalis G3]EAY11170.1 hypothetical protein TVAG_498640 [Trichomonas vaginalis G3]KAI5500110.1 Family of unknown function (DUF5662) family [Trichomonas vaginalis G3]|eukprot:XP_001323393.1 hypothetical protein [Trichomonas vaginalis G3]